MGIICSGKLVRVQPTVDVKTIMPSHVFTVLPKEVHICKIKAKRMSNFAIGHQKQGPQVFLDVTVKSCL